MNPDSPEFQMQLACMDGHHRRIEKLLSLGVNANFVDRDERAPSSYLSRAARNGHLRVVLQLLEAGANPNPTLPVASALQQGHFDIAEVLLEAGADINHADRGRPLLTQRQFYRWASPEVVEWLLQHGADPTATDARGLSGLERARRQAAEDIVSLLED